MKPHVCPKCDGDGARMAFCAPCKGAGIVWEQEQLQQTLAPNPYIPIYPQPYVPAPFINPFVNPFTVTCGQSSSLPGTFAVFNYSGTIQ